MKVIEYKLYPNKTALAKLEFTLEQARFLYNKALEERITSWKEKQKGINYYDQTKSFKGQYPISAMLTQCVLKRLDTTCQRFFKKNSSFPRFKSRDRFRSIDIRQWGLNASLKEGKLRYDKMLIRTSNHRELEGIPKMGRIVKRADGWYLQVICEVEKLPLKKKIQSAIGLDMGLKYLVADSEGNTVEAPKLFRITEAKLAKQQRTLCKRVKGSYGRNKARQLVAKTHLKIQRQRKDFLHKLSYKYAQNDLIAVEKLNIRGMLKNHHLAKSISDASWNMLLQLIRYKAENAGGYFVEVNPRYTSQKCSRCGAIVQKSLSVRTHICPECSLVIDRDTNASLNILRAGIALGGEMGLPISLKPEATRSLA
jgi:putative transposase